MPLLKRNIRYQWHHLRWGFSILLALQYLMAWIAWKEAYDLGPASTTYMQSLFQSLFFDVGMHLQIDNFRLPYGWLLTHLIALYLFGRQLWRDHEENGIYCLFYAGSRRTYFYAQWAGSAFWITIFGLLRFVFFAFPLWMLGSQYEIWSSAALYRFSLFMLLDDLLLMTLCWALSLWMGFRSSLYTLFVFCALVVMLPCMFLPLQGSFFFRQGLVASDGLPLWLNLFLYAITFAVGFLLIQRKVHRYDFLRDSDES